MKIAVLCTGNSCRSQMAEGFLKKFAPDGTSVFSAGIEAHGLNQFAVRVMQEAGIDISHYHSKTIEELPVESFDYVITVCDHARENCPYLPARIGSLHQNFEDPGKAAGTEAEVLKKFRKVRDEIEEYCRDFWKSANRP